MVKKQNRNMAKKSLPGAAQRLAAVLLLICLAVLPCCKKKEQQVDRYFRLSPDVQFKILDKVYPGLRKADEGWFVNGLGRKVRIPHSATQKENLLAARGDFDGNGQIEITLVIVELVDSEGQFPGYNISLVYLAEENLEQEPRVTDKVELEMLSGEVKPLDLQVIAFGKKASALGYIYHKNIGGSTGVSRNLALIADTGSRQEVIFETVLEQTIDRSTLKREMSFGGLAGSTGKSASESTTLILHPEIGGVKSVELTGLATERFIYQGQRLVSAGWAVQGVPGILKKRKGYDISLLITEGVAPAALEKVPPTVVARDLFYPGLTRIEEPRQLVRGVDSWGGPADLSAEFSFSLGNNYLELEIRVEDDKYVPGGSGAKLTAGDHLVLSLDLDLRHDFQSRSLNDDDLVIAAGAGNFVDSAPEATVLHAANATIVASSIMVTSQLADNGYTITLKIPRTVLEGLGYRGARHLAAASLAVIDYDGQTRRAEPDHIIATDENYKLAKPLAQNNLIPTALKINLRPPPE